MYVMGKRWTKAELDVLKHYLETSLPRDRDASDIASRLGRSTNSVIIKAGRFLKTAFSRFSDQEDRRIREYYRDTPAREFNLSVIANELGRPRTSVSMRASTLGVSDIRRPKRTLRFGEDNPQWKGDQVKRLDSGRRRARRLYRDLGMCERCGISESVDRHHKDRNTLNNSRSNIQFLCRRCHVLIDGRSERLRNLPRSPKEAKPCVNCGIPSKPLRKGRCHRCNEFLRRRGREWTPTDAPRKRL